MDWKLFATGLLRHALTALAGVLVTHGLLTAGQTEAWVGGAIAAIGAGWSFYDKYLRRSVEDALMAEVALWKAKLDQRTAEMGARIRAKDNEVVSLTSQLQDAKANPPRQPPPPKGRPFPPAAAWFLGLVVTASVLMSLPAAAREHSVLQPVDPSKPSLVERWNDKLQAWVPTAGWDDKLQAWVPAAAKTGEMQYLNLTTGEFQLVERWDDVRKEWVKVAVRAEDRAGPVSSVPVPPSGPCKDLLCAVSRLRSDLVEKAIADIEAADALAGAADPTAEGGVADELAHACYPAEVQFLRGLPAPPSAAPAGPIELYERARLLRMRLTAGLPNYLKRACAPLFQDEQVMLTKLLGMIGVTVGTGGLGLPLPALLP